MNYDYDVMVIGGGGAGLTASKTINGFGKKVALVEKTERLGGECTWTGCVPSKALIKTAEVAWHAKQLEYYGIKGSAQIDTKNVMQYVQAIVHEDYQSHTPEKIKEEGIDVLFGNCQFIDNHTLKLDARTFTANKFILCTGSSPAVPPIEGLDSVPFLTNDNLFTLETLPQSMIILGGGPIGAEMASALNRLGVSITMMEMNDRILPREDAELVAMLSERLTKEGVTIKTGLKVTKIEKTTNGIKATAESQNGESQSFEAETILVAVGRKPNLEGLNLQAVGVQTDKHGIKTDKHLKTTAPNIWAAGDIVGPYLFSHMAWYQGVIAARNAIIPFFKKSVSYENVIWVTFTAPELARAGMLEDEARQIYGDKIQVFRMPYDEIDRAVTDRARDGLGKFICDKKGRLLGIHILGAHAGDIIHEAQAIKTLRLPFTKLFSVIHAYPTYSELIWKGAKKAYIHGLEGSFFVKLGKKLL